MADLYSLAGGSFDLNADYSASGDTSSGMIDTGLGYLGKVADIYLQYEKGKTQNDLEYLSNPYVRAKAATASVPSWVWIVGALGVAFVAYRTIR
jgi:hypothetical protein